ncbi:MAG: transposase [Chloroflexi bacterium]|nr:transposase [Chloroflexota bacterium]
MSRRYTDDDRRQALECLKANGGNCCQTSQETGIPVRTLRTWARQARQAEEAADVERALAQMRQRLIDNVLRLANSLEAKIDDAPLNQHASALAQLVDRLIKLAEKLPPSSSDGEIRQIEYIYPDGSTHHTPPWADDDSEV